MRKQAVGRQQAQSVNHLRANISFLVQIYSEEKVESDVFV